MLKSPATARIRLLALARLRSQPALYRRYQRARSRWLRRFLIAMGVFGILFFTGVVTGVPFIIGQIGFGADFEVIPLMVAIAAAGVAIGGGHFVLRQLVDSRSLAVASVLAMPDRDFALTRLRVGRNCVLIWLACCISFGAGVAWELAWGPRDTVIIMLLCVLMWGMSQAWLQILLAWLPGILDKRTLGMMFSTVPVVIVGSQFAGLAGINVAAVSDAAILLIPTGWPIAMIRWGLQGGITLVWWLLIPCGVSLIAGVAGWYRLLATYQVRELTYTYLAAQAYFGDEPLPDAGGPHVDAKPADDSAGPRFDIDAVFDDADAAMREARKAMRSRLGPFEYLWSLVWRDAAKNAGGEVSRAEAAFRVRSREFLEPVTWSEVGLIERIVAASLSEHEQRTAELMVGRNPEWTRSFVKPLVSGLVACVVLLVLSWAIHPAVMMLSGHVAIASVVATWPKTFPTVMWRASSGHSASMLAFLPVSHKHIGRTVMLLGLTRCLLLIPFVAAYIGLISYAFPRVVSFFPACLIAAKGLLLILALHALSVIWALQFDRPVRWYRRVLDIMVIIFVVLLIGGACIGLFVAEDSELGMLAATAVLFGSIWLTRWLIQYGWLNKATDLIVNYQQQAIVAAARKSEASNRTIRWGRRAGPAEAEL